ncbi:MAG: carbon-nitrogen hydrolase family protein [Solirubrobacteraceae bacterium]
MRVAAVQLCSTSDVAANLHAADLHVRAAAADGAELVVLPEKWPLLAGEQRLLAGAQTLDGEAVSWARSIARELSIELVAGSLAERVHAQERLSNTSLHIGADGAVRAVYRKLHMFDVDLDGRTYRESATARAGSDIVLSELRAGTDRPLPFGLAICYDLRFPELFRILALRGALIVTLPSAFTRRTTRDHWEILLRARAIENASFVIAANQVGPHGDGHDSGGRSMIVDPWGVVLAVADDEHAGHVTARLDLDRQREVRETLPSLANRREDAYLWPARGDASAAPPTRRRVEAQDDEHVGAPAPGQAP